MLNLKEIQTPRILFLGSHPGIIQAVLDFDFLAGNVPSVVCLVLPGKRFEKFFFGDQEILIRCFDKISSLPQGLKAEVNMAVSVASGRRTYSALSTLLELPELKVINVFAEDVPELHAVKIYNEFTQSRGISVIGPASIGLMIPGQVKLGAIGGVQARQLVGGGLFTKGNTAVFAASGGMTNELINILARAGRHLSFSLSVGGDRFPVLSPQEAFLMAQADENTESIVYYGELGGDDEYVLAELIETGKLTKKVVTYIAGSISEMFETPPQFGHAKAMASSATETASAKRQALRRAGAIAPDTFEEFAKEVQNLPIGKLESLVDNSQLEQRLATIESRRTKLFSSSISGEKAGEVEILGKPLLERAQKSSIGELVSSLLLGRQVKSTTLPEFTEFTIKLLVDNGPYQSGVLNTMITARAGRDMISSLAAGLLTIGPRFGGATNAAAANWLAGVGSGKPAWDFVEEFAARREYIQGIGHKKYTTDEPDPRVEQLLKFLDKIPADKRLYSNFAREVEQITSLKKANLILNVDGCMGAVLLDILATEEELSVDELKELSRSGFFDAFFVIPRSIGLIAHHLDQKRLDEGLVRLSPEEVGFISQT